VRFQCIQAEKATFPIRTLCRVLDVSPSGYYAWAQRPPSARATANVALRNAVRVVFAEHKGRYGSPRIHRELRARGHRVGRKRVMGLMRAERLRGRMARRFRTTTDSTHHWPRPLDRVQRQFRPAAPNQLWVADVTYINTAEGWLYLAIVLDLFSRRVVGWALRTTLQTELVAAALHLALGRRRPPAGLVHHSDQGVQYASAAYQQLLAAHGLVPSMSRRGDCWDNAVAESFFSTLKGELQTRRWPTRRAACTAIATYIDDYYNVVRRHSTLDYHSPLAFEAAAMAR
jgi:transposase InsO family protein